MNNQNILYSKYTKKDFEHLDVFNIGNFNINLLHKNYINRLNLLNNRKYKLKQNFNNTLLKKKKRERKYLNNGNILHEQTSNNDTEINFGF